MHKYVVVDAFSNQPLSGNPVAVFFHGDDLATDQMQRIAREMNLSETTFVLPSRTEDSDAHVRIFTPVNELPFAGHPLLGTAVALGIGTEAHHLHLETAMGVIPFTLERAGERVVRASMRQPVPWWKPFDRTDELLHALDLGASTLPVEIYVNGPRHVLVGLDSVDALSQVNPDHRALSYFADLAVNCYAGSGGAWRNRMFSPSYGVVEDAATGSAAGPIAIHLARHGLRAYGQDVYITQGVEIGRPSLMEALVQGAGDRVDSVEVRGHGVITAEGLLHV
ncbi:PhzF family phenazine biosynthesis isomerase [Streptomyces sp. NBC_00690]|uniref:PhzF family phenazine biosynthesis isomerase n=1 Tax=Streptomyces sp. NBC_00690 TaxID=2975808 RepID=UPI002E286FF8|nr:PhzF family phenazine biosynthesis isomerase [Streptomyces sp. NBC_00690]